MSGTKNYHLSQFSPYFEFLATIVRDVTGFQQRHHWAKYTSFSCKDQRLSTEGKIVSKYCNISKTLGREGLHQLPPPPPPHSCATVRVCICVYVRGLSITDKTKIANIPFSTPLLILPIISFLFVFSSPHFDYIYFSFICLLLFVLLSLVVNLLSTVVRLI